MSEITPPSSFRLSGARSPGTGSPDTGSPGTGSPNRERSGWQRLRRGKYAPVIAFGFTIAAFGIILLVVLTSETWPRVQKQFFNWNKFTDSWGVVSGAFLLDIRMFVIAEIVILAFALLLAVLRSLRGPEFFPLRALTVIYIDIFRGVPLLLIILLLGFGVPALQISWLPNGALFWGVTALVLSYSAYTAEVYRSGIESVHESQRSSARSLGLTQWQAMRFAILPQAVRNVVPALLNGLVSLQKDVALVYVLGIRESVREAQIITARTFNYTPYLVATVLFLLVSIPFARFADWYAKRDRLRRTQAQV